MRITVQNRRTEALEAGFKALAGRISIGFEDFASQLTSWNVQAFCDGERVVGMLMTKGDELHVAVIPQVRGRWLSRRLIREVFSPFLGRAKTKVSADNAIGRDFCERIRRGFACLEFDPTTALVAVGSQLVGGAIQGNAAKQAAGQQAGAANAATGATLSMFNTQNTQQAPYRAAGTAALTPLQIGVGTMSAPAPGTKPSFVWQGTDYGSAENFKQANLANYTRITGQAPNADVIAQLDANIAQARAAGGETLGGGAAGTSVVPQGYFTSPVTLSDLTTNLDPAYEFIKGQGIGAVTNAANAVGGFAGNTLKGITDYATNFAKTGATTAYDIYQRSRDAVFNRLASVAGLGQVANAQGVQTFGAAAPTVAGSTIAAGTARAGGTVGQANAVMGGANSALGWYALGNMINPSGATVGMPGGETTIGGGAFGAS